MADNARIPPTPSPAKPAAPDVRPKKHAAGKDRRSCDGNLKISYRYHQHRMPRPMTIWADGRHKGDFDKELAQLLAIVDKRKGQIAWAAIYDCSTGRFGPEIALYTSDEGWRYHNNH